MSLKEPLLGGASHANDDDVEAPSGVGESGGLEDGDGLGAGTSSVAPAATISFWHITYRVNDRLRKGRKKVLLDDISGIVRPGQVLAIMGPSGCGKTSILEILGARNSPTEGGGE
ncbi:atp-binding sub-family g member 2c, partial [Nannochloropsis gaditana]